MMLRSIVVIGMALTFSSTAVAQVTLKNKIAENATWKTVEKSMFHQVLKIAGQEVETKVDNVVAQVSKSGKRKDDGTLEVQQHFESMKSNYLMPGGVEISFDSTKPAEPQGTQFDFLIDLNKAITKSKSTVVYGKNNRVEKVTGYEDTFKEFEGSVKDLVAGVLDPKYLKRAANIKLDRIPDKAIKKGDTWSQTETIRVGGGQELTFKMEFKYLGTEMKDGKTLHKINTRAKSITLAQPKQAGPAKISNSDLKIDSSEGTILFDAERGVVVSETANAHITGNLTLEINDMELKGTLDLKMDSQKTVQ